MGQRAIVSAAAVVVKAADDPAAEVRLAAIRALGRVAGVQELPVLTGRLLAAKTPDETAAAQESLDAACARIPDRDACAGRLRDSMAQAPVAARCVLLGLLGRVGGPQALAIVSANARSDNPDIQDAATRALGDWRTPDAAPELLDLAKTLGDAKFKIRALRGYLRIARQMDLPDERRLEMCKEALQLAQRGEEKKLAMELMGRIGSGKAPGQAAKPRALFDGRTFDGWEGDTAKTFRIQEEAIVGGSLKERVPHNAFLCTTRSYTNFVLRLECRLLGQANGGIQIRSQRVPHHYEVSGFQADMSVGADGGYWGCLYDESRRNRVLVRPERTLLLKTLKPDGWNQYEIRCEGPRIQLFLNGVQTVDYTEKDAKIPQSGIIGLQIHGGPPSEAWYRNIRIEELP